MSDPTLLKEGRVKARKTHGCSVCTSTAVQPGDTYLRSTYAFDGRVYDWLLCTVCESMTSDVWDWVSFTEDGIGADEYGEWASENREDPRSVALYERMGWNAQEGAAS